MKARELFNQVFRRQDGEARPQAGTRFGISWPLLAALCLILVCAVGWAFFMGLMVGRGQNPQASIHAATGLMKPDEPKKAEQAIAADYLEPPEAVLPGQMAAQAPESAAVQQPAAPGRVAPKKTQPKEAPKKPQSKPQGPEQRYAYTFQAGAYRSQNDAKAASTKLNGNGLKSTVQKSGKVWLVVISLQGGGSEVAQMRQKVKALKMPSPMQLSRKPVEQKKRKRD